ncbi:MAG: glycosyltransferase family 2 protein, partial [Muribaculaceae bacterium]|nr:glycosyltransferase family 2 protein [Muribaculaceae bacterium]
MEQSEFEITVVIPVYNRAGIVGRTLETLDAQVFQDFYVILVDNNSTDGTLEVLQQWAGKHPGRATVLMQPTP